MHLEKLRAENCGDYIDEIRKIREFRELSHSPVFLYSVA
jgi:hypothetical protein